MLVRSMLVSGGRYSAAFGEDELVRRMRTHPIPFEELAVGYGRGFKAITTHS